MDPDALIQPQSHLKLENNITCNLRALSSSLAASRRSSMSISTSGISSSWKAKVPTESIEVSLTNLRSSVVIAHNSICLESDEKEVSKGWWLDSLLDSRPAKDQAPATLEMIAFKQCFPQPVVLLMHLSSTHSAILTVLGKRMKTTSGKKK